MKTAGLLLTILLATGTARAQDYLDCKLAPGWEQSEAKHQYASDNLWEYKDGAAEGYLQYGFVRMQGISCKSGGDALTIDVSEMSDADSAYGMFVANRDPNLPVAKIGMGGQVQTQSASFAKGKYYVELVVVAANPESNQTAALEAFAAQIEAHLEGRTTVPEALEWFPKEDLTSTRLVPESVLGLRLLKRGYQAKYKQGQAFIVLEATPESAAEILKKLREKYEGASAAQVADEAFQAQAQYLGGICIFRKGRYLGGYANLPDPQLAVTLAAKLAARIP
ncbi:MAG: hypothetical protein P4K86_05660 [Terracidiphilus sp.]|nr:hypothetical protein [Terracidiphilus sp.]MDR3775682.1 hypothetical protein [Terracidiphilus sp.]